MFHSFAFPIPPFTSLIAPSLIITSSLFHLHHCLIPSPSHSYSILSLFFYLSTRFDTFTSPPTCHTRHYASCRQLRPLLPSQPLKLDNSSSAALSAMHHAFRQPQEPRATIRHHPAYPIKSYSAFDFAVPTSCHSRLWYSVAWWVR